MTNSVLANVQNLMPPNAPPRPTNEKKKKKKKAKAPRTEGMSYGKYHCSKCKAQWGSANSRADVSQECKTCGTRVLPVISPPGKNLTPYQGKLRCFGTYKCTDCSKTWASGNSWADMGQECKDCLINIYPHKQRPLLHTKRTNNKPHLEGHCEMCKTLRHSCTMRKSSLE